MKNLIICVLVILALVIGFMWFMSRPVVYTAPEPQVKEEYPPTPPVIDDPVNQVKG